MSYLMDGLKNMLASPKGQTVEGRIEAFDITERAVERLRVEKVTLARELKARTHESNGRLTHVFKLEKLNDELHAQSQQQGKHVTALQIDNMMLQQENDRLRAELARLSAKQA